MMLKAGIVAAEKRCTNSVSYSRLAKCSTISRHSVSWVCDGGMNGAAAVGFSGPGRWASGLKGELE